MVTRRINPRATVHELEFARQWKRIGAPGSPMIRTPGGGEVTVFARALPDGGLTFSADGADVLSRVRRNFKQYAPHKAVDEILKLLRKHDVPWRSHRSFPRGFGGPES